MGEMIFFSFSAIPPSF